MARIGGENSDQIDPLVDYSSLFLFPRCFTYHPNPNISSAGSVYSHLKSMVLRNPENLLKQAKTVIDDSLNLFKNDKTSALASEDKMDAVFVTNEKNPQVKRPALGLKQEKFSAKPMPGQPYTVTEPSIDISKLEDPLEFEAYERMENSKKEMKKLRGEPLNELDQNLSSLPPGSKRLSLMGKSATYRHQSYTSMATDDHNKTLLSSEEAFVNCSGSPVHWDVQSETDDVVMLPKTKVHDSSTSETWKDCDLHKLFSSDYDALDAADVLNLLHEKLDVKVQKFDSTSHLNGARKAIHGKLLATGSQSNESKVQLAKSPLASISMLNRRISKLSPSMDPFSVIDIDSSPDKSSSRRRNGQQGDARMEMYGSHRSFVHAEESSAVDRRVFSVNGITSSSQAEDQLAEVGQCGPDCSTEQLQDTRKSKVKINESNAGYDRESPLSVRKRGAANVGQFDGMERQEDSCQIVRSPERFNDRVADPCFDFVGFAARDGNPTYEDKETENEVLKDVDSVHRKLNIENFNIEKSTVNEVEGCELVEASITKGILSKEPAKKTRGPKKTLRGKKSKASSQASPANETVDKEMEANTLSNPVLQPDPPKKRRKQIGDAPAARKKNEHRRTNLYGDMAGTEWDAGVRRSTRIRMRPLEYWKGERFIYGRVEDSLVTVIGVKYASPSKEAEQPRIKVKSFL